MSQKYVRLTKHFQDKGILVKQEEVSSQIKDKNKEHYQSTYYYNEEHFKEFQKVGSIKGIKDVTTNQIWWDFDSSDLKLARKDTIELVKRLNDYKITSDQLEIYFSGNKGFHVIINVDKEINRKQVENFSRRVAKDLKTFDTSLYDESQVLRIPGTKHHKTEYFKTSLTHDELLNLKTAALLEKAKIPQQIKSSQKLTLPEKLFEVEEVKVQPVTTTFDISAKPKGWKGSKFALLQGFYGAGERSQAMMIIASTCRALGYDESTTYHMCLSSLEKSWEKNGKGSFDENELQTNIINQVFGEHWNGGQYSEKNDMFLQKKADELGIREIAPTSTVNIKGALKLFKGYAKNIDELTLKTGIQELDAKQRITVGMSWGIIAAPGVGKTSCALQMLHAMSKAGELCVYLSYDMFAPHVVQKIIQKHWKGNNIEEVFEKYKAGDEKFTKEVEELIEVEYPNVEFCFESGQSIDDIKQTIRDAEQKCGKKCKFVVVDYNELVITDVSDPTQSSNKVAQQIRALASNEQICILSLFQPNKLTGDPSVEIKSYRAAKGGSGIEQSVSLMLGMSRPGFDPRRPDDDKYVSLNCVKNRMGSIFYVDLYWNGYEGMVRSLTNVEKVELKELRAAREAEKNGTKLGLNDDW